MKDIIGPFCWILCSVLAFLLDVGTKHTLVAWEMEATWLLRRTTSLKVFPQRNGTLRVFVWNPWRRSCWGHIVDGGRFVCPLGVERTSLQMLCGFSLVHSQQRNFLSNVWGHEYVHASESKCLSHPGKIKYRHTLEIFRVCFQTAAVKWVITFLLVEDLAISLCWEKNKSNVCEAWWNEVCLQTLGCHTVTTSLSLKNQMWIFFFFLFYLQFWITTIVASL